MAFELVTGDILDAKTDALLLTIDGTRRGMEGNIARQFARRWPDDWEDMQRDVRYPVPQDRGDGTIITNVTFEGTIAACLVKIGKNHKRAGETIFTDYLNRRSFLKCQPRCGLSSRREQVAVVREQQM